VVAGVIGLTKFSYDLWGHTVNVAQGMESNGIPGKIQVTPAVYDRLKDKFSLKMRGAVEIEGKGEMMVYIVSGWMGMIKSRSIIPHPPTDHSPLPIIPV
jgi:class 3 adenylate cyclase